MKTVVKYIDHIAIEQDGCPPSRLYPCFQVQPLSCGLNLCHSKGEIKFNAADFDQFASDAAMLSWFDALNVCFGCYQPAAPPVVNNTEGLSPNAICYADGTCGYVVLKINEDTETITPCFFDEAFVFVGNVAPKEIVKCPEYQIITEEKCIQ